MVGLLDTATPTHGLLNAPSGLLVIHARQPSALAPPASFWPDAKTKSLFERPFTVDRAHTPPYVAGYSNDGHTIFIHHDFPKSMTVGSRTFDPEPFVVEHERVEKAFIDAREHRYQTAHSDYATQAEHDALKAHLGFTPEDIRSYDAQMSHLARRIAKLPNKQIPTNLDTTPYRHTGNMAAVR